MILRSIEVENFRKFMPGVAIHLLGEGLNVIVGDNEEGKSILLQAVRSAFFDRHSLTGDYAESFLPYKSKLQPRVTIRFTFKGAEYRLTKGFCQDAFAELQLPDGGVLRGLAAEEQLEKLLRFERPGRGPSDERHQGVWAMFWVEQGRSLLLSPNPISRSTIASTLEREVGDVLGGRRGQRLLAAVRQRYNELFTSRGTARGEYAVAGKRLDEIKEELERTRQQMVQYEGKVDNLERVRDKLRRYDRDRAIDNAGRALAEAERDWERVKQLKGSLEQAVTAEKLAQGKLDLATTRATQRAQKQTEVQAAGTRCEELRESLHARKQAVAPILKRLGEATETHQASSRARDKATQALRDAEAVEKLARARAEIRDLSVRIHQASEAQKRIEKARASSARIPIEKKDVTRLRKLNEELISSNAQLQAAATHVSLDLAKGVEARLGGRKAPPQFTLTTAGILELAHIGRITIVPGGDLDRARAQAGADKTKLEAALAKLGVSDAEEAQALCDQKQELLKQVEISQEALDSHAPEGLSVLQERLAGLQAAMEAKPVAAGQETESVERAEKRRESAKAALRIAEKDYETSAACLNAFQVELAEVRNQEASVEGQLRNAEGEHRRLGEGLAVLRAEVPDSALHQEVIAAKHELDKCRAISEAAGRSLEGANPEEVRFRLEAARKCLANIEKDIAELKRKTTELEIELRATGQRGLGEQYQQLEGQLQVACAAKAKLDREAAAVSLLYRMLTDAEKQAKETFLKPVTDRIAPYLKLLFPGARLDLNEDMQITGLTRAELQEPFDSLSMGTREQLAVLTRLAFADLLAEHEQPAAVILDDAIVNADDRRFDRMLRILQKASERFQVIILSCREREYQRSGAPLIRLADCRR